MKKKVLVCIDQDAFPLCEYGKVYTSYKEDLQYPGRRYLVFIDGSYHTLWKARFIEVTNTNLVRLVL